MSEEYSLQIAKPAVKSLQTLELECLKQIMFRIVSLKGDHQPHGCKSLKGCKDGYRVDQGEYRIFYTIEENRISVFKVGKRENEGVYRSL